MQSTFVVPAGPLVHAAAMSDVSDPSPVFAISHAKAIKSGTNRYGIDYHHELKKA